MTLSYKEELVTACENVIACNWCFEESGIYPSNYDEILVALEKALAIFKTEEEFYG